MCREEKYELILLSTNTFGIRGKRTAAESGQNQGCGISIQTAFLFSHENEPERNEMRKRGKEKRIDENKTVNTTESFHNRATFE